MFIINQSKYIKNTIIFFLVRARASLVYSSMFSTYNEYVGEGLETKK